MNIFPSCLSVHYMYGMPEDHTRAWKPQDWSYRCFWVVEIQPGSSGRTAVSLHCWAISLVPNIIYNSHHYLICQIQRLMFSPSLWLSSVLQQLLNPFLAISFPFLSTFCLTLSLVACLSLIPNKSRYRPGLSFCCSCTLMNVDSPWQFHPFSLHTLPDSSSVFLLLLLFYTNASDLVLSNDMGNPEASQICLQSLPCLNLLFCYLKKW